MTTKQTKLIPEINKFNPIKILVDKNSNWYTEAINRGDWTESKTHMRDAPVKNRKLGHVAQQVALELLGIQHNETGYSDAQMKTLTGTIHIDVNSRQVYNNLTGEWDARVFYFKKRKLKNGNIHYYTVGYNDPVYYAVGLIDAGQFWTHAKILNKGEKHQASGFVANDRCGLLPYKYFRQPVEHIETDLPAGLELIG